MVNRNVRTSLAVALVAVVMLVAGGVSVASNTGFKINKQIFFAGAGAIGDNWISVPYFNPYGNFSNFCSQTGLTSTGIQRASLQTLNPATGVFTAPTNCGTGSTLPLTPGQGVKVRQPNVAGAPTSLIIVGSHNPALAITVPQAGSGNVGSYWFSVPYHTTAVTANDLCLSSGLTSTGISRATVVRVNAQTGATTAPLNCGSTNAINQVLVLGEAVRIREPRAGGITFIPAHF